MIGLTNKKIIFSIVMILLMFSNNLIGIAKSIEENTVLAALSLNIARFTNWPEIVFAEDNNQLNLCVIGDNIVQESFGNVHNQMINGRSLQVFNRTRQRNFSSCHAVFIQGLDRNHLSQVLLDLKQKPILTIGDDIEFAKAGGMVALQKVDGKIQLNINLTAVKQTGLVISSRILKLANIVN